MLNQIRCNGVISSVVKIGTKLYVGGTFATINGLPRYNFAEFDLTTGNLTSWAPIFDSYITKIAACGSSLMIIGKFSNVNGDSSPGLSLVNATSHIFTQNLFTTLGITDLTAAGQTKYNDVKYHTNSDNVFVSGQFSFLTSVGTRNCIFSFGLTSLTISAFSPISFADPNSIWLYVVPSFDIDQTNNIIYISGGFPTAPQGLSSYNISNIDAATIFTWNPSRVGGSNTPSLIRYFSGTVFVGGYNVKLTSNLTRSTLIPTNATSGSVLSLNTNLYKQAFNGDATVGQILSSGSNYYIFGHFSSIGNNSTNFPRSCFAVINSSTGQISGDSIEFLSWQTVTYVTKFQSLQPAVIYDAIFDDDKLHVFKNLMPVDGNLEKNTHLILNANGSRVQKKFAVFI